MSQPTPTDSPLLDLIRLCQLQEAPPPFTPGEPHFWTDPHIAQQMLAFHLNPDVDAASRPPQIIAHTVAWIIQTLALRTGDNLLDLGCGPGLYAVQLAQHGLHVSGMDFSQNSIDYAQNYARQHDLPIHYRCQDYLTLEDENQYDAVLLIYGDFCPLSPEQRAHLLSNVQRALKPGGRFVLDVSTPHLRQWAGLKNGWYAAQGGFWKPGPHLVLEQGFAYPESVFLDQYTVIEPHGKISVYRNWFQDYTPNAICAELEAAGFTIQGLWGDLMGAPYDETSDWIGIIVS